MNEVRSYHDLQAKLERLESNIGIHDKATAEQLTALTRFGNDIEAIRCYAGNELCDLLTSLGYVETVAAFNNLPKWYT